MVAAIGMLEGRNSTDFFSPQVVGKLTQLPSEHVATSNAGNAPASKTPLPDLSTRCTRGHDRCRQATRLHHLLGDRRSAGNRQRRRDSACLRLQTLLSVFAPVLIAHKPIDAP
jgi:hypothetical protein